MTCCSSALFDKQWRNVSEIMKYSRFYGYLAPFLQTSPAVRFMLKTSSYWKRFSVGELHGKHSPGNKSGTSVPLQCFWIVDLCFEILNQIDSLQWHESQAQHFKLSVFEWFVLKCLFRTEIILENIFLYCTCFMIHARCNVFFLIWCGKNRTD